jgi:Pentapeptide repeats (8 copies)
VEKPGSKRYSKALRAFLAGRLWSKREAKEIHGNAETDWEDAGHMLHNWQFRQLTRARYIWHCFWQRTGLPGKTVLDLVQLVGLPLAILLITNSYNSASQRDSLQNALAQKNLEIDKAADDERQKLLDEYLKDIMSLVKEEDPWDCQVLTTDCKNWNPDDTAFSIARAKTFIAIQSLDPRRQRLVIQSLQSTGLNTLPNGKSRGLIAGAGGSLARANLKGADLEGLNLDGVDLQYADLQGANLVRTSMIGANLKGANLSDTKIESSSLIDANLENAYLFRASLVCTRLMGADFTGSMLSGAKFYEPDKQLGLSANSCPQAKQTTSYFYHVEPRNEVYAVKSLRNAVYNKNRQYVFIRRIRGRLEKVVAVSLFQPLRLPWEEPYATEEPTVLGDKDLSTITAELANDKGVMRTLQSQTATDDDKGSKRWYHDAFYCLIPSVCRRAP